MTTGRSEDAMRLGHLPPVFLTVQVSRDGGRTWTDYLPAAKGTWTNPTTYPSEAERLRVQADLEGHRYVRCLEDQAGKATRERWNTASLWDSDRDEHWPDLDALPEGAFVPPSWRRRRT